MTWRDTSRHVPVPAGAGGGATWVAAVPLGCPMPTRSPPSSPPWHPPLRGSGGAAPSTPPCRGAPNCRELLLRRGWHLWVLVRGGGPQDLGVLRGRLKSLWVLVGGCPCHLWVLVGGCPCHLWVLVGGSQDLGKLRWHRKSLWVVGGNQGKLGGRSPLTRWGDDGGRQCLGCWGGGVRGSWGGSLTPWVAGCVCVYHRGARAVGTQSFPALYPKEKRDTHQWLL